MSNRMPGLPKRDTLSRAPFLNSEPGGCASCVQIGTIQQRQETLAAVGNPVQLLARPTMCLKKLCQQTAANSNDAVHRSLVLKLPGSLSIELCSTGKNIFKSTVTVARHLPRDAHPSRRGLASRTNSGNTSLLIRRNTAADIAHSTRRPST